VGTRIRLRYEPVAVVVDVDVDERAIVNAHVDWGNQAEGTLSQETPATPEMVDLEREARAIVDQVAGDLWPRITP
jgi:hypothetical protein